MKKKVSVLIKVSCRFNNPFWKLLQLFHDVLYDNMGNFEFEYAAKVREKKNNIEFLGYYDDTTKQMTDTYIADKWADDIETEIRPYIKENFGDSTDFFVFYDDRIGDKLGIDPVHPESYKDFNAAPTIRITIPRKKNDGDEELFNSFISYLKNEDKLQQGFVAVEYIAKSGEILEEEEWSKEF
ncbi:hypothetical protein NLX67_21180 [Domibacillus sp. A3M-37]|uniref:hypothetical protein n=1 Tax=Domibacillus sp. A3M-37 TaxID=2962037 RepID=UPI0020B8346D|nr:hypothetical protein [Domibacillus sp. A3M-37]MCP3764836.1 hypothetical protein [Domibacillus sp. A3M-37]